jgi:surfactin synthase thioesterase subunit
LSAIPTVHWQRPGNDTLGLPPRRTKKRAGGSPRPSSGGPTLVACFPGAGIRADELPLPDHSETDVVIYRPIEWRGGDALGPPRTVAEMVSHAYEAIADDLDQPMVFYGHCLGAIVAYELALQLQKAGHRAPGHLLVAGAVGPHKYVAPDAQKLPVAKLLELLDVLKHPWAERLKNDPGFLSGRIDTLRADLGAMAAYEYEPADPLDAPITAVSLRHDLWSYPRRTDTWAVHTRGRCEVVEWEGDHYFAMRHPERVHELLVRSALAAPAIAPAFEGASLGK